MNAPTPRAKTQADPALVERWRRTLVRYDFNTPGMPAYPEQVGNRTRLIPKPELSKLVAALKPSLAPATERQLEEVIALIAAAWPYAHQKQSACGVDLFVHQLAEDLAEFPVDILHKAVKELRRSLKFSPSIAEIYCCASDLCSERRAMMAAAQKQQQEHEKRDTETRAKTALNEEDRRDLLTRLKRLSVSIGPPFDTATVEDMDAAWRGIYWGGGFEMLCHWTTSLNNAAPWVGDTFPFAILAHRVSKLRKNPDIMTKILTIARRDLDQAREILAQVENNEKLEELHRWSGWWSNPENEFRAIIAGIVRRHGGDISQPQHQSSSGVTNDF